MIYPDGKYIAYASNENGTYGLWIRNLDGSYKLKLVDVVDGDASPQWSPDGKEVARWVFAECNGNDSACQPPARFENPSEGRAR
jgi:Tol biopolymer transport system component